MGPHYSRFLDALAGKTGEPVLFEPFIPVYLTEQLIWRRGSHLWDTVPAYLETLLSLRERTYADVPVADMRLFGDASAEEMGEEMARLADGELRFAALCSSPAQYTAAVTSLGVCAVGLYGWADWFSPVLQKDTAAGVPHIAMDSDCQTAADNGFAGWFCPGNGEHFWEQYRDKIAILGGLGDTWLAHSEPVAIHRRCE